MTTPARPDSLTGYGEMADVVEMLGMLVREARRARGLSLRAAADQIGIHASTVMRIEQGQPHVSDVTVELLRWLDLTTGPAAPQLPCPPAP